MTPTAPQPLTTSVFASQGLSSTTKIAVEATRIPASDDGIQRSP